MALSSQLAPDSCRATLRGAESVSLTCLTCQLWAEALRPLKETFLPRLWVGKAAAHAKGRSLLFSSPLYLAWDEGEPREVMKTKALKKTKRARGWGGPSKAQRSQIHFKNRGSLKAERRRLQELLSLVGEKRPLNTHVAAVSGRCQLKKVIAYPINWRRWQCLHSWHQIPPEKHSRFRKYVSDMPSSGPWADALFNIKINASEIALRTCTHCLTAVH